VCHYHLIVGAFIITPHLHLEEWTFAVVLQWEERVRARERECVSVVDLQLEE
jgi:hypothetical protein